MLLVERIREVRALLGFTRIESNADFAEATVIVDGRLTKLSRESPNGCRRLKSGAKEFSSASARNVLLNWQAKPEVQQLEREFLEVAQSLAET